LCNTNTFLSELFWSVKINEAFLKTYVTWNHQTSLVSELNSDSKAIYLLHNLINISKIIFRATYFLPVFIA
jgi:hypothetical protein